MRESDIVWEGDNGKAWVYRDKPQNCYTVMLTGITHSTSDSSYPRDVDGLSIAIAYAAYRDKTKLTAAESLALAHKIHRE